MGLNAEACIWLYDRFSVRYQRLLAPTPLQFTSRPQMDPITAPHLSALKQALLTLKPTGANGFEGLLAAVLSDVCKRPFRLAASGSQRGRDGNSALDEGATFFEAKLYRKRIDAKVVLPKLVELANDDEGQVDTWALCATSEVGTQISDQCTKFLSKIGIGCLILDWAEHTLPTLAVVLALSPQTVEDFISTHSTKANKIAGLRAHLEVVTRDVQFAVLAPTTRKALTEAAIGFELARGVNRKALTEIFSDRREARRVFGQPLAPLDSTGLRSVDRPELLKQLAPAFVETPSDQIFAVMGEEGTGKSWLVASAWMQSLPCPLFAVFTADELIQKPLASHDFEGTLIVKLASIGEGDTPPVRKRWERRFRQWKTSPKPETPRIVVFVDGLNQAPDFAWADWIDLAGKRLEALGGRMIVTTTERHYARRLRNQISMGVSRIIVADWSEAELGAILDARKISADGLSAMVARFLRNPRILGIAVELLNARDIERFDELTIGRLLFEHIRRTERYGTVTIPVDDFVAELRKHADEIIERCAEQQRDDLKLFPVPLDERLRAVAGSRFFEAVSGDPQLYAIKDDGLPLALGLSLVRGLVSEHRNGRDPSARLSVILEPVLALAETSEVVFSALEVASLDNECPEEVTAALIEHLLSLQNLSEDRFPAFAGLVKDAPGAFALAARNVALSQDHQPWARWLTAALLASRGNQKVLPVIRAQVSEWLSYYSLAPERRMIGQRRHDSPAEFEAEKEKREQELSERQSELSEHEREFIASRLVRLDDGNLSNLQLLALQLLAGLKLVDVTPALVNFAFSSNLNGGFSSPDRQFEQLLSLNTADWNDTRTALLASAEPLMRQGTSKIGQWAAVEILRATGNVEDAVEAENIYTELIKDRQKLGSWRLIENYCATDPCDPRSSAPSNIVDTATRYAGLDAATLKTGSGYTMDDHFFDDARAGLARFDPQTAIKVMRAYARDAVERRGLAQRHAIYSLLPHSALFDDDIVDRLVKLAIENPGSLSGNFEVQDSWAASQYGLFAAMVHQSGNEQLSIVADLKGYALLLPLLQSLSAAEQTLVEQQLEAIIDEDDVDISARIMSFIYYSHSPLSARAREFVGKFFNSPDKLVRALAFGLAARLQDRDLLMVIALSDWSASALDRKSHFFERWHGSAALIAAAKMGVADPADILDRIALSFYPDVVELQGPAKDLVIARIDKAFVAASSFANASGIPLVEQTIPSAEPSDPPSRAIIEDTSSLDSETFFERMKETREGFGARQKRAWNAVDQFAKDVTVADAAIIVDDFSWSGFDMLVSAAPAIAKSWMDTLLTMRSDRLRSLHYFALGIARAFAKTESKHAATLLRRLAEVRPLIKRMGHGFDLSAEAEASWFHADIGDIKTLCFERLDRATTDAQLAEEIQAAYLSGKSAQVSEYIDLKLASGLPSSAARALMVAGFCDADSYAARTLERFAHAKGFLGAAYETALYAYDRNIWARHWYDQMRTASTPEDFWCYSTLFTKIADARFSLWQDEGAAPSSIFRKFFPTVKQGIRSRVKNWNDKRSKTLFGRDIPDQVFLTEA